MHKQKRIHQYHSTKILRIRVESSGILAIAILGTSFIIGMFFSH